MASSLGTELQCCKVAWVSAGRWEMLPLHNHPALSHRLHDCCGDRYNLLDHTLWSRLSIFQPSDSYLTTKNMAAAANLWRERYVARLGGVLDVLWWYSAGSVFFSFLAQVPLLKIERKLKPLPPLVGILWFTSVCLATAPLYVGLFARLMPRGWSETIRPFQISYYLRRLQGVWQITLVWTRQCCALQNEKRKRLCIDSSSVRSRPFWNASSIPTDGQYGSCLPSLPATFQMTNIWGLAVYTNLRGLYHSSFWVCDSSKTIAEEESFAAGGQWYRLWVPRLPPQPWCKPTASDTLCSLRFVP